MKMKLWKSSVVTTLVLVLVFMGFSHLYAADKDSITIIQAAEPVTLNPLMSISMSNHNVFDNIFDTLLRYNNDVTGLEPCVGLSMTLTKDPKVWEVKIRPGVKAHNGEVIDAEDVAWSFNDVLDPNSKPVGMKWVQSNTKMEKAVVIDPLTVHIHTTEPNPDIRSFMTRWYVRPKDYYTSITPEEAARKAVGSGPYKLVKFTKGDRIVLEANKDYWEGEPAVEQVVFRSVPEVSARIAELNTGGADIVYTLAPDLAKRIDNKVARLQPVQGYRRIYIQFNFTEHKEVALIQDKRVRLALNYGVDFQNTLDSLLGPGVSQRKGTFINPPVSDPRIKPFQYNPQKALSLMKEAGYYDRNGDGYVDLPDGKRYELTLQYSKSSGYLKGSEIVQAICADWQKTGIYVEAEPVENSILRANTRQRRLPTAMTFRGSGFCMTGQGDISQFCSFSTNFGYWVNETYDKTWTALSLTFDDQKRKEIFYDLEKIMQEEAPIVFLYMQMEYYGVGNRLDWTPTPIELPFLRTAKWAM
ncbi:MAG: ABC transporter substrate-binding protein [Desulfobacteraceae bacterium]|nr:ABC transporter substrate-binding protein [Desulfobacteraceae bacterium]